VSLGDERYMLFTTFRRDGTPVSSPVWVVPIGEDTVGFWTSSESGKAKRLAHTDRVTVQPCNGRGVVKPGTSPMDATAHLVVGAEFEEIRSKVVTKYGAMTKIAKWMGTAAGALKRNRIPYGDRGVVVSLSH
jgi:uncharacterized protein